MMFNRNTAWKRPNDSYRIHAIGLSCMILMGQIATAQTVLHSAPAEVDATQFQRAMIGNSIAGQRIASVTCDPFMSPSQEKLLMNLLSEQDDSPWINFSLQKLRDKLSNSCAVHIDEKSLENENLNMEEVLRTEVPSGALGVRLSEMLSGSHLTFSLRRNRLEIAAENSRDMTTRRIYDVTPLVVAARNRQIVARNELVYPLAELIESTIAPDTWQNAGGTGVIREFIPPNAVECVCLVIVSSTETHLAIQNLLDQLNFAGRPAASDALTSRPKFGFEKSTPPSPSLIKRWYSDRFDANPF